mgnify:CR=1 FL=1
MAFFSGGKKSDDKDKIAKHNAILAAHGHDTYGPSGGASPSSKKKSGGGGKGGSNPNLDPREDRELLQRRIKETTQDDKWGYYAPSGQYVSGFKDMFDGGGKNTTGTYFEGGPLSTLLNVAKIRPAGMARERDAEGNYVVPSENIGFRNVTDMFDRGGPQASGGEYRGAPYGYSNIFNALDKIGGVDQGERVAYDNPAMEAYNRRVEGLLQTPQNSQAYLEAQAAAERERQRRLYSPRPMLRPPAIMGP